MLAKIKAKVRSDSDLEELLNGSVIAFALKLAGVACTYIFTFFIARYYGAEAMGIFALSFTMLQIASIVSRLGLDTALLRFISQYASKGEWVCVRKVYRNALQLVLPASLVMSLIFMYSSPWVATNFFQKESLKVYFQIAALGIVPFSWLYLNTECLRGLKEIKSYAFLQTISPYLIGSVLLILLSFIFPGSNHQPVIAYIISIVLTCIGSIWIWKGRSRHKQSLSSSKPEVIRHKALLKVSGPMLLASSMFLIMQWTDTLMLGALRSEEEVGVYSVCLKIANITSLSLMAINSIAAPKFAEMWGKENIKGLEKIAKQSTKMIVFISTPILLVIAIFPSSILNLFGNEFTTGYLALILLVLGQFINSISGSVGYILQMTEQETIHQKIIVLASIINVFLNYILIPTHGITGAALASMASTFFWNVYMIIVIRKKLNINIHFSTN